MKIYHYASVSSWRGIQQGSWQSGDEPGLGACLRVCKDNFDDEGARDGAVFGLLEPEPEIWVKNTEFPAAWQALMSEVGRLLLTYEPTDEIIDKSFLIDWSHKERFLGGHKDDLSKEHSKIAPRSARVAAERAYWGSRRPLADYIESPRVVAGMVLPEVITMCNVPASVIEIADMQPRLHDISPYAKEDLLRAIDRSPELGVLSAHIG